MHKETIAEEFRKIQDEICKDLEELDGHGLFAENIWERPGGGGGRTRVLTSRHIEKGGVNFSAVEGDMPERIYKALGIGPNRFFATGVSIVLHGENPHVPIIHMNIRYFETDKGPWWFGGGIDMTPHYIDLNDARQFHEILKTICDKHNPDYYEEFKSWADDYFYLKHRKETRGIGGIFFDRMDETRGDKSKHFGFVCDVGRNFVRSYSGVFKKYYQKQYTQKEKEWQLHRRGRYAEFNLVWDKGTRFGLDTDGNTESILMSLPPEARWTYNYQAGVEEKKTLSLLRKNIDWINYTEEG